MNKIAVLINDEGMTTSFEEKCFLVVYKKIENLWEEEKRSEVDLHSSGNPRAYLKELGESIEQCKNIVCSKMIGIAYQIFERLFFDIWEVEGEALKVMDYIYKESLVQEEGGDSIANYIIEKETEITVDLVKIAEINSELSSKKILQPILKTLDNKVLLVKCSHTPPWLKAMDEKNSIKLYERKDDSNVLLTIQAV